MVCVEFNVSICIPKTAICDMAMAGLALVWGINRVRVGNTVVPLSKPSCRICTDISGGDDGRLFRQKHTQDFLEWL